MGAAYWRLDIQGQVWRLALPDAHRRVGLGRRSSVVERTLGKGEVRSSILRGGTTFSSGRRMPDEPDQPRPSVEAPSAKPLNARETREARLAAALRANLRRRKAPARPEKG